VTPPPVMTTEFNDAVRQLLWEWDGAYWYWAGRFQPIEDEL